MEKETITSEGQVGEEVIVDGSSSPDKAGSSEAVENLSLKELNEYLGKNYKDKGTALKSLKDTFSYVGKKVEAIKPAASNDTPGDVVRQLKEVKDELFYSKNPQYDSPDYRKIIGKMGENPAEVVSSPEFKSIFDKASSFDKAQKQKTVLESNPRIGTVRNKQAEAKTAVGNRDYDKANQMAVDSVLEAYEM